MGFTSINPATGEIVWEGASATAHDIDRAVAAARQAFADWSGRPLEERAQPLRAFAALLAKNREDLAAAISLEVGKPHWEALTEVQSMIAKVDISIEAHGQRCGEIRHPTGRTRFKPHGVVAVLGPFNFPGHLPNGHIVPALLAGNTVIFKPSEHAPLVAEKTAALWTEAGLPPGVLNLLQGRGTTGAALARHPGIDGLFFTGSARTGLELADSFAQSPEKILALEMGGNNPLVVHGATDVTAAAVLTVQSAFLTAGQRCTCARRLIVPVGAEGDRFIATLAERIEALWIGPPAYRPEPFMGPVISVTVAERLLAEQKNLLGRGARAVVEMKHMRPGTGLISPALIDVTAVGQRTDEELFGPFLQLVRVDDFAAAIGEANRTVFGLAAGLVSDDAGLYRQFFAEIRAGIINWNTPLTGASSAAPFGGVGQSGNHRPGAWFAADYCSYPVASLEQPAVTMPASLPPGLRL